MKIIEIIKNQKEKWNRFVADNPYGSFLQSYGWGEFQESLGRKCWRFACLASRSEGGEVRGSGDSILATALVIKHNLPFGKSYLYSPHGPIISESNSINIFKELLKEIRVLAKKHNSIFWRMDPILPDSKEEKDIFKKLGFKKTGDIQPSKTLILDITKSEEELLNQMHHKTRYNIRLAQRKGVRIRITNQESGIMDKDFETFWKLLEITTRREKFKPHPKDYYRKQLAISNQHLTFKLFLAEYQNKVIVANVVAFFNKRATYLHGASSNKYRNVMAPHLLQWHQILEAKKRGCTEYDFWGIDEKKWPGVTRFKKGFGGREINYIGAYDLIYQPTWYKIYKITKAIL